MPINKSIDTKDFAERLLNQFKEATLILDENLSVHKVNRALSKFFRVDPEDIIGHDISDLGKSQWDKEDLRLFVNEILSQGSTRTVCRRFPYDDEETGLRTLSFHGKQIDDLPLVLVTIDDVTDRLCSDYRNDEDFNQLELLAKASSDVIYWMSPDWSEIKQLKGRKFISDTKEKNSNWLDRFILPEEQLDVQKIIEKTIEHKEVFELTHRSPCSDAMVCWTFSRVIPILNDQEEIVEWIGMAKDITQNIETERRLLEQEKKFRSLAELSPEAILVNVDNRWVYANESAVELLGANKSAEIVGQNIFKFICPEYHARVHDRIKMVFGGKFERSSLECKWQRSDGTPVDVQIVVGPSSWQDVPACQLLVHDISARKKVEKALQDSKEDLQQLANAMPQLVWTANAEGEIIFFNERYHEFEGVKLRPDGKWDWVSVLHPDDKKKTLSNWSDAFTSVRNFHQEHRLNCKNGSYAWFLTRATPIRNQAADIIKWIGTTTNINELKNIEIELNEARRKAEKANLAKREFLSHMSHEIRTPLTVFLGAIEHLQEIDDDPEHTELLELAENASNLLRNLIDDILDFSRIEAGQVELKKSSFDLRDWLNNIIMMFRASATEQKLKLKHQVSRQVPSLVIGDSLRLKQVLTNLISNALKFTPKGEVKVSVTVRDNLLEFTVADTGIGIPEEKQGELFKAFSQLDSFYHRRYKGTGLGLAISRELITLMGGQLGVCSSEGDGSEFTFTVPLQTPAPSEQRESLGHQDDAGKRWRPCSILMAEDDEMVQKILQRCLMACGWQVDVAASGSECLEKWRTGNFELILMDLQMPEMDGLETTRQIRREESGSKKPVKIIGLTAWAEKETSELCREVGMDYFLTKPVSFHDLQEAVIRCLSS